MIANLDMTPEDLWKALQEYCVARTGCEVGTVQIVSKYNAGRVLLTINEYAIELHEAVKHRLG